MKKLLENNMQALATNSLVQKYTKHGLYEIEAPKTEGKKQSKYSIKVTHWYLENLLVKNLKLIKRTQVVGRKVLGIVQDSNLLSPHFNKGDWVLVNDTNNEQGLFMRNLVVDQGQIVMADPSQILIAATPASTIHDVLKVMTQMEADNTTSKWISLYG